MNLHIAKTLYHSQLNSESLKLLAIPAGQRRKLSSIAKTTIALVLNILQEETVDYIVWVSQLGEEKKTVEILSSIEHNFPPSPLLFSSAVHNSIAGLYSILTNDETPYTSLGIGKNILINSLFEAQSYIQSKLVEKVLLVIYDEPLPELFEFNCLKESYAFACLLTNKQPNLEIQPIIQNVNNSDDSIYKDTLKKIKAFHHFLNCETPKFCCENFQFKKYEVYYQTD